LIKVLVTGGAGFIGSNLVRTLLEKGYEITVLDISDDLFRLEEVENKIKYVKGDLRDRELITRLIKQVDVICHLGGQVSHLLSQEDPYYDLEVNIVGTINILEAMKRYNPSAYLIYASSRSVYGKKMECPNDPPITEDVLPEPIDAYGITKLSSEHYTRLYHYHYDLKTTILRQANVFGERQQLWTSEFQMIAWVFRRVWLNEPLQFMGDGKQTRDFLYAGDLINAFLTCIDKIETANGEIYNVGGKTYCTWLEAIATAEEVTGNKAKLSLVPYTPIRAKLENPYSRLNGSKIKRQLGWQPKVTLAEGFKRMKEFYETTKNIDKYLECSKPSIHV